MTHVKKSARNSRQVATLQVTENAVHHFLVSNSNSISALVLAGQVVHAPDDAHRQDDVGILAALEEIAKDIVSDAPDEGDDFVMSGLIHSVLFQDLVG